MSITVTVRSSDSICSEWISPVTTLQKMQFGSGPATRKVNERAAAVVYAGGARRLRETQMPVDNQLYDRLADTWWNDDSALSLLRTGISLARFGYARGVDRAAPGRTARQLGARRRIGRRAAGGGVRRGSVPRHGDRRPRSRSPRRARMRQTPASRSSTPSARESGFISRTPRSTSRTAATCSSTSTTSTVCSPRPRVC